MDGIPGSPDKSSDLITRVKGILLKPGEEWPKIQSENKSVGDIVTTYALPLIAIGPVAGFIGGQVFGYGAFGFSYRPGLMGGLGTAVVTFVMGFVGLFVLTFIANFLAPRFGGQDNQASAFRLVAYSLTASWVAGIFGLIPALGFLGIAGLYSIYLFYTGVGPMMKIPQEKAGGYVAVTILAAIVVSIILGLLTTTLTGALGVRALSQGPLASSESGDSGSITIPGMGKLEVDKIEQAAKRMEDQASGKVAAVDSASLKGLLPASIGAFQRTAIESTSVAGMGNAQGTYEDGDNRFDLTITDTNAMGALAGMGAAMGMEQSREDADGYERTGVVDGRMQSEKWNNASNRGKFGMMIDNRFMVEASGTAPNIDVLKAAVATVSESALSALAQ
ncbi:MAG: YIP1 family protein [Novosphingobium sp.]|nr:YIP1 family protein [Novosphingobium sp.]